MTFTISFLIILTSPSLVVSVAEIFFDLLLLEKIIFNMWVTYRNWPSGMFLKRIVGLYKCCEQMECKDVRFIIQALCCINSYKCYIHPSTVWSLLFVKSMHNTYEVNDDPVLWINHHIEIGDADLFLHLPCIERQIAWATCCRT
jgi:hypothetical protein